MQYVQKYSFIVIICLIVFDVYIFNKLPKEVDEIVSPITIEEEPKKEEERIIVDIKGAIRYPGVYAMNHDDRIIDVIELSGGLVEDADTSHINLSKKVTDEMTIVVSYVKKNDETVDAIEKIEEIDSTISDGKVSLNKASLEQLMSLSGIGESKAMAIIEYRNTKLFDSIEELTSVKGISASLYEKVKDFITI